MTMKDDKLNKAISELPEFKAPDVWNNIRNELPRHKFRFFIPFLSVIIIISLVFVVISHNNSKINKQEKLQSDKIVIVEKTLITEFKNPATQNDAENISHTDNSIVEEGNIEILFVQENTSEEITDFRIIQENQFGDEQEFDNKILVKRYKETGENLVNNPGFEEYRNCPKGIVGKPVKNLIPHWNVPSKGTPDYFNACSKQDAGVPSNFAGYSYARSGVAYAGIILRQNFTRDNRITGEKPVVYREYIQTELKHELEKGRKYRIVFYVVNSTESRYAVDAIGACITAERISNNSSGVLNYVPAIENQTGKILSNRDYWVTIEGVYEAKGGEKYLTIGNFKNNFLTRYMLFNADSKFNYAYYYIDDVSVREIIEHESGDIAIINNRFQTFITEGDLSDF